MGKMIDSDLLMKYIEKYERWAYYFMDQVQVFNEIIEENDDYDAYECRGYHDGCHETCSDITKDLRRLIEELE